MASGFRRMRINTQERAVSTDINRLQSFIEQDVAEMCRNLLDVFPASDDDQFGTVTVPSTSENPLRAEIVGGLLVKPQAGSLNLLVDAGMGWFMAPDAAADESNYKFVRDDGVTSLGALTLTAGGGGATRIDVIECQVNPTEAIVSDNRDIFNPTTGLFAATSVTKELKGRLSYRVRSGTAGGGFASVGTAAGWVPICVVSVPAAATNCDGMTFWDVRPMVEDRNRLMNRPEAWPMIHRANFSIDNIVAPTEWRLRGQFRSTVKDRDVGGIMRRGTPGTDNDYVDVVHADNFASGFTYGASGTFGYLYLLTPFGLPRWARYTTGPSGRVPRSPKGIPVVAGIAPKHMLGTPSAAINMPTSTGLGGSTSDGIVVCPLLVEGSNLPYAALSDGKTFWLGALNAHNLTPASGDINTTVLNLIEGTTHPANARAVWLTLEIVVTLAANSIVNASKTSFRTYSPGAAVASGSEISNQQARSFELTNEAASTKQFAICTEMVRVPLHNQLPATASGTVKLSMEYVLTAISGGAPTYNSSTVRVHGWDLGP